MFGTWSALGLTDVETLQPTSTPDLGGWIITADGAPDGGVNQGGVTCTAALTADAGVLSFTCLTDDTPPVTACASTLSLVTTP